MYIERKKRAFGNHIEIIEDLQYLLKSDGFQIDLFDFVNDNEFLFENQRGKELIVQKDGTSFWSFNASLYSKVNSSNSFDIEEDTVNSKIFGHFTVSINSSYDENASLSTSPKSAQQPKYDSPSINSICAGLNKEGRAKYTIYSSPDGWDWLVVTEFEGYTFFAAFGNKSKGLSYQGNYSFGTHRIDGSSSFLSVPVDLNTTLLNNGNSIYPANPFAFYNTSNYHYLMYYDDGNGNFLRGSSPSLKVSASNPGTNKINYEKQIIKGFNNDYSGINSIGKVEYFCKLENPVNVVKTFYNFDIGFINIYSFENGEERTINGKRYKFHHLCKRIDNQSFDATVNKGNCGFWFQLGDKNV